MANRLLGGLAALNRELQKPEWADANYTIVVDENTFRFCLPEVVAHVEALQEAALVEVPTGEACKSLEVATQVWQTLLEADATREAVLVGLGGGSVCDLTGYVAAGYKRGIRHIFIPTTLLGMTDAAIGGKNAVDLSGVKNAIGHFYPPLLTVLHYPMLATLPQEELLCGLMEMVKTAAVTDATLYTTLTQSDSLSRQSIRTIAQTKQRICRTDPIDRSVRRILNFGHTTGHAIESHCHMPHGLAVGVGMAVAMYLSVHKVGLDREIFIQYLSWLRAHMQVPTFTLHDTEAMLPLIHHDKKNAATATRMVLLPVLGEAMIDVEVSDDELRYALLAFGKEQ